MVLLYVAILRLAELDSQGVTFFGTSLQYSQPIRYGDSGNKVSAFQYFLSVLSEFYDTIPSLRITGTFDRATLDAVRAAQRQFGLTVDGIVGRDTWHAVYDAFEGLANTVLIPETNLRSFPGNTVSAGDSDFENGGA